MSALERMEDAIDLRVRSEVLKAMQDNLSNCRLYDELASRVSNEAGGTSDFGMGTHRLLATIHTPLCTDPHHREGMAYLWGE